MDLRRSGDQTVDEREWTSCVEPSTFFRDIHIDDENPIGMILDEAEQPFFQCDSGSNVAPPDVFDSFSDLADCEDTEKLLVGGGTGPPCPNGWVTP